MTESGLILPTREAKPREKGLTVIIDNGVPLNLFRDTIRSSGEYIDFVKFGWGTSVVTHFLERKIACLQDHGIEFFFGGTLFEKFLSQDKVESFYNYCKTFNCSHVEISNGTVAISNRDKTRFIKDFADEFTVFSEVGHKDSFMANNQDSTEWIESIYEDIEAGASKVITEARESGTSGICRENGDIRIDIFEQIADSGIPLERLIFEAPNKKMQTFFIKHVGANVNLANIALLDVISLETLRLGLRSDTFNQFRNLFFVNKEE
ncbi:phosphosulfolactate synthase [Virgibacillus dakarensis]|uniref:Phosphosulfolactate synthase n=1 Tax=Lentibacillus populi TaxID=1827502 RepID=A0A9W5X460_9BACI|nr:MULTISPECIES: phosphosulfolactate synthase [Bacillaceae]MBT2214952.1 phosphosulfolactate synthase [Virgibacillus dakarensis]MTW84826.1 phosphosulfolactate synthase [Virgibacillus dakarensis]GGB31517.1 phosphosulfolactate synthase [Lentibacillus populi]